MRRSKSSRATHSLARAGAAVLALVCLGAVGARAQERGIGAPPPPGTSAQIIARAGAHLKAAEDSFARGDFDHARTEFDSAMDEFLLANYDMRSDKDLQAAYRDTVERIHRYQTIGVDAEGDSSWPLQAYEATKDDFRVEDLPTVDELAAASGDLANASFLVRLAELQRRFRAEFGRDFVLTGRDTEVHTRLYGYGRAFDVRVRDLPQTHVQFIVANARALRMRVLDFSTSDRVAAHNARVLELGRSVDTMATGLHLHVNDLPRPPAAKMVAQPAAKRRLSRGN